LKESFIFMSYQTTFLSTAPVSAAPVQTPQQEGASDPLGGRLSAWGFGADTGGRVAGAVREEAQSAISEFRPIARELARDAKTIGGAAGDALNSARREIMSDLHSVEQSAGATGKGFEHAGRFFSALDIPNSGIAGFNKSQAMTTEGKLADATRDMGISGVVDLVPVLGGADFLSRGAVNAVGHALVGDLGPAFEYNQAVERGDKGPVIKAIAEGSRWMIDTVASGAQDAEKGIENSLTRLEDLF
jgi:hypothetical protein